MHTPIHRAARLAALLSPPLLALLAGCTPAPAAAPALPAVYVTPVAAAAQHDTRQLGGVLGPRVESELAFRTGGLLTERAVDLGQRVRRDQVLARLDTRDLELAAQAAAERLREAETDAVQAASDAARFTRLLADGSVGGADAERQRARADAAAARLAQARSQLEVARNRLGYTALTAPFDGVVTAVRAQRGQVLSEGQPVLVLARSGELEVAVDVPEQLAGALHQHQARAWLADDPAAAAVPLRLRELAATAHPVTRTYAARYAVDAPPPGWRLGRSVTLSLAPPAAEPSTELPLGAVVHDGRQSLVWIVNPADGSLLRQAVQVHAHTAQTVRVRGLPAGALVVSAGAHKLDAGMRVRPVRRPLDTEAREAMS